MLKTRYYSKLTLWFSKELLSTKFGEDNFLILVQQWWPDATEFSQSRMSMVTEIYQTELKELTERILLDQPETKTFYSEFRRACGQQLIYLRSV